MNTYLVSVYNKKNCATYSVSISAFTIDNAMVKAVIKAAKENNVYSYYLEAVKAELA